ncbi:MAG: hypothetical protein Q8L63_01535, partial [Alphaproteobacteria bacterium]|nr:hypothetical protein [Alphaproteobacteria bacterium]
ARMMGIFGRIQREGQVVHLVARQLRDLSGELASVSKRGWGGELHPHLPPKPPGTYNIHVPDAPADMIRIKTRDFK